MQYREYIDTKTGNHVQAIQAGHGGTLLAEQVAFIEGDWIVKPPINLMGDEKRMVVADEKFKKEFKSTIKSKSEVKKMSWNELAELHPPKITKRRKRK